MIIKPIITVIVDDEPNSVKILSDDLKGFPDIEIVEATTSIEKAQKSIEQVQPDLLFLDIELGSTNGVEFLQTIRPYVHRDMHVVFYTAFDKYMLDAIRNSAFDYLLKPYQTSELIALIGRVRADIKVHSMDFDLSLRKLLGNEGKVVLQTMTNLLFLRRSEILYFEYTEDSRTWVCHLSNQSSYRLRTNVRSKDILKMGISFICVNSSCIINLDYLASVENQSLRCKFYPPYSDIEIFVSRRYYSKIKEALEIL